MPTVESCESLLQAMIGFDTVNAHISGRPKAEYELSCFMEAQAAALGFATRRLPVGESGFNLLIACRVNPQAPWLLFESHLDTVSVEGMTIEPFVGRIDAGRISGRGSCDTKGSGAAMLWALHQYAAASNKSNNIAIVYTLDEEVGKNGVRRLVEHDLPALGFRPAGVIVGEPTRLLPVVAHNGVVRWSIRTRGLAAHSADPSQGRSAISAMVRVIQALESRYVTSLTATHPLTGKAQCSVNVIHGGVQINIIPESCEIRVDRRVVPGEDPESVLPAVERLLDGLRREDPLLVVTQEPLFIDPPLDPTGAERFIGFVQAVLNEMKLPAAACGVGYATDASNFANAGIPAVVLGPGDIAQAHTCDEWLELSQLHRAVDVYLNLMRSPLGAGS